MNQQAFIDLTGFYESDETAWLEAMAELIEQGRLEDLDYAHLGEYLSDMAHRDRREVKSRLVTFLAHLIKWEHQAEKRTGSCRATIIEQQTQLEDAAATGVLRNHAEDILSDAYEKAIKVAAAETGLPKESFAKECPYSVKHLLTNDFTADQ